MSRDTDALEQFKQEVGSLLKLQQDEIARLSRALESVAQAPGASNQEADALKEFRQHEQNYANTILLLGYGGFFALWTTTAGEMPRFLFGLSGSLIGISILSFVTFELAKSFAGSIAVKPGASMAAVNARIESVIRWWFPVFLVSAITGLGAGAIVLRSFTEHAWTSEWTPAVPAEVRTTDARECQAMPKNQEAVNPRDRDRH